ncbi:unnamed protein product [Caenorhabditis brenneri]
MSIFASCSVFSVEAPKTDLQAASELKANGMSQPAIDGISKLDKDFSNGFKKVSGDKTAENEFIEEFRANTEKFIDSMSSEDRSIYKNYLKKYEIDKE